MHDAACDSFALAAASIGDHVGEDSQFPWALALRLSAFLIAMAEIVAIAEEELGNITFVVDERSSHNGQSRGSSSAAQDPEGDRDLVRLRKAEA